MHKQGIPDIDLFIEQDTERTPEVQKFYVIYQGQILASYKTLRAATAKYNEVKKEVAYVPPSVANLKNGNLADAVMDEWLDRTEAYWSNSSSYRTTNKVRR